MVPKYIWAVSAGPFCTTMAIPQPSPFQKRSIFCSLVAAFKCRESLGNDLIIWCWFLEVRIYLGSSYAFSLWHNGNVFPLFSWAHCFHESYCSYYINWAHGETEGSHIQWFGLGSVWMGGMGNIDEARKVLLKFFGSKLMLIG